jgi:hypothetical protein
MKTNSEVIEEKIIELMKERDEFKNTLTKVVEGLWDRQVSEEGKELLEKFKLKYQ